jgi:molybdate transport system substrate-binding protein
MGQVLTDLGSQFMLAAPDATGVSYRFDTPATLIGLIQQGADADVIVSLDRSVMDTLQQANLLDGSPSALVGDQLAIVTGKANPQHLQSLADLANAGVRFIVPAPASPTTAALTAAFDAASHDPAYGADFSARADRNVLARDGDDRLVISRILAGEVSAGVVFASSVDQASRAQLQIIAFPRSLSAPTEYSIGILKNGSNPRGAQAFVTYALSTPAQDIFSRYGFTRGGSSTTNATR